MAGSDADSNNADQMAQTFSKIDTWAKINRANKIILDTAIQPYKHLEYMKDGDPELCGLGSSRYVLARWNRVE